MSMTPARRSARITNRTPSVAQSAVGSVRSQHTTATTRRVAQPRAARGKGAAGTGQLPVLPTQISSAYGASGQIGLGGQQAGTDFTNVFGAQREEAVERDAAVPGHSSPDINLDPYVESSVHSSPSVRSVSPSVIDDQDVNGTTTHLDISKSYGDDHEGGMLEDNPLHLSRNLVGRGVVAHETVIDQAPNPSTVRIVARFFQKFAPKDYFSIIVFLLSLASLGLSLAMMLSPTLLGSYVPLSGNISDALAVSRVEPRISTLELQNSALQTNVKHLQRAQDTFRSGFSKYDAELHHIRHELNGIRDNLPKHIHSEPQRHNFFLPSYGARVVPSLTSPTMERSAPNLLAKSYLLFNRRPAPNSPAVALERWEEPGDCWCAAPSSSQGNAQLTVDMGRNIYPNALTVEHIHREATLEPLSAPKNLEVWAYVPGAEQQVRDAAAAAGLEWCSDWPISGWVCVGSGFYDLNGVNNVQTLPLAANMKALGVPTHRISVRVTSNWGAEWTCLYRLKMHGEIA
jgi:hypothetical protein